MRIGIVNKFSGGHHAEYDEFFISQLNRRGHHAYKSNRHLFNLEKNPLLFTTLDDATISFCLTAFARSVLGQRTVGLYLRPSSCFEAGIKYQVKRAMFRALMLLPNVRVLSLLPYSMDLRFQQVSTGWLYDPQFWDLDENDLNTSDETSHKFDAPPSRKLLLALGLLNSLKGFDLLVDLYCSSAALRRKYRVVAAGVVDPSLYGHMERLRGFGGEVINRNISRAELMALYKQADIVWACYHPSYDQSSGIFGRAMQHGIPTVVREGSFLDKLGFEIQHPCLRIPFSDRDKAAHLLENWHAEGARELDEDDLLSDIRKSCWLTLADALGLCPLKQSCGPTHAVLGETP